MLTLSVRSFHDAGHALHLRLAAELAVGADLARDARHLGGERRELVDHRVDGLADAEELALDRLAVDRERDLLREVAVATASITRATSVVGRTRSSIMPLTASRAAPTCPASPERSRARSVGPRARRSGRRGASSRVVRSRVSASSLNARASSPARPRCRVQRGRRRRRRSRPGARPAARSSVVAVDRRLRGAGRLRPAAAAAGRRGLGVLTCSSTATDAPPVRGDGECDRSPRLPAVRCAADALDSRPSERVVLYPRARAFTPADGHRGGALSAFRRGKRADSARAVERLREVVPEPLHVLEPDAQAQ